jgi:hypothetical protein
MAVDVPWELRLAYAAGPGNYCYEETTLRFLTSGITIQIQ